jgi:hypothetical protein
VIGLAASRALASYQESPLTEAGLIDADGLKAAVTELETGPCGGLRGASWSR